MFNFYEQHIKKYGCFEHWLKDWPFNHMRNQPWREALSMKDLIFVTTVSNLPVPNVVKHLKVTIMVHWIQRTTNSLRRQNRPRSSVGHRPHLNSLPRLEDCQPAAIRIRHRRVLQAAPDPQRFHHHRCRSSSHSCNSTLHC